MKTITFKQLKDTIYEEGFQILVYSDSKVRRMAGFSYKHLKEKNTVKGAILPDKNEIIINSALDLKERVLTLIHELVHIIQPKYSERKTESETHKIYHRLKDPDLGYLEFAVSHSS